MCRMHVSLLLYVLVVAFVSAPVLVGVMVAALLVLALPFAAAMVVGVIVSLFLPLLMPFTWGALPLVAVSAVVVALFTMPTLLLLMCVRLHSIAVMHPHAHSGPSQLLCPSSGRRDKQRANANDENT